MKMVVGLGNPERKYNGTRHNVGFEVIGELAARYDIGRPKTKFNGEIAETIIHNEKTILVSPLTYMNLSGQCVQAVVDFYKLDLDDLLVVCDDLSLDVARIRIRKSGSAGGQKGLRDINQRLGSQAVPRLRVGIGKPPPEWDVSNFVLGKFSEEDRLAMDKAVRRSADAVEVWVRDGIQTAMNKFNANPNKPKKEKKKAPAEKVDNNVDNNKEADGESNASSSEHQ